MKKPLLLLALAILPLAGCSLSVNLASQRNAYNNYVPVIGQTKADYEGKVAFYREALAATRAPKYSPYPEMAVELETMRTQVVEMQAQQKNIEAFRRQVYDPYVAGEGKTVISTDDKDAWARFQGVQSRYQPLAGAMEQALGVYRQSAERYRLLLDKYRLAKVDLHAVKQEMLDLQAHVHDRVADMGRRVEEDGRTLRFAHDSGADPGLLHHKGEVLDKMHDMLPNMRMFSDTLDVAARQFADGEGDQVVWTGPGMPFDGNVVHDLHDSETRFHQDEDRFEHLSADFDAVPKSAAPPAQAAQPQGQPAMKSGNY